MDRNELAELQEQRAELMLTMEAILGAGERTELSKRQAQAYDRHEARFDALDARIKTAEQENREALGAGAGDDIHGDIARAASRARGNGHGDVRDDALRAIDTLGLEARAGDRITELVERDAAGLDARYIAAVSAPEYQRAFMKVLRHGPMAHLRMQPEEARALAAVNAAEEARSMVVGDGPSGGFAVPAMLDPSILLTSEGAINPLRELAMVSTVLTSEWRGITTDGVSAEFVAEGTEADDNTPTLDRPAITPERAQAWIPFSIEWQQDAADVAGELGTLFVDAKNTLEAEKHTVGAGRTAGPPATNEPEGILVGVDAVAASKVAGATSLSVTTDDVYALRAALPPRFQAQASWLSSGTVADSLYRAVGGNSTEPPVFGEDGKSILRHPFAEASNMPDGTTAGDLALVYGDIRAAFRIVDRIGLSVELVPHVFGANGRPKGERGLFAYWRTSSKLVVPNAVRAIEVIA